MRSSSVVSGGKIPPPLIDSTAIVCFLDDVIEKLVSILKVSSGGVERPRVCGTHPVRVIFHGEESKRGCRPHCVRLSC